MNIARHIGRTFLMPMAAAMLVVMPAAEADDTDIYVNPSLPPGSEPMVMFSLDYRSNLGSTICSDARAAGCAEGQYFLDDANTAPYVPASGEKLTFFDVLRLALRLVFADLDGVKVGLMLNHDHKNNCAGPLSSGTKCSNGGYIARGLETLEIGDANGAKAEFHSILENIPIPQGNVSHSYQGAELFFEFFRYLTGQDVYNGHNGWTDYGTNNAQNLDQDGAAYSWDTSIEHNNSKTYLSPLATAGSCAKMFTINMMFQVSNQDADSDSAIEETQANGGMAGISLSNNNQFVDTIDYLNDVDLADGTFGSVGDLDGIQSVDSYFIVDSTSINQTTTEYAQAGGTVRPLALAEDPEVLVDTLTDIFDQILSVSTTFVAASVPVNVFNRAEIVDNVYIAIFQADDSGRPYWPGNLKKLKFETSTLVDGSTQLNLVDKNGNPAIAPDGRIRFDALTHWTDPDQLPAPDEDANEVEGADGRSVERGAAGQKIPGLLNDAPGDQNSDTGARQVLYDAGGVLAPLNADTTTATALQSALGAADSAEALELVRFMRGQDVDDLDADNSTTDARSWLLGDPLHSRPRPLNYGALGDYSGSNPAIFIAMGSNDGAMRLFRNTTTGGAESGEEVWAFYPTEAMGIQKVLRDNAPVTPIHPYSIDGAPAAWTGDADADGTIEAGEDVWLFFGMRRGGRHYYGLDVSDPENPIFLWKIGPGTAGFGNLGYTFANPQVGRVETGSGVKPAVFVSGGYDLGKDSRSGVGNDDSIGNAFYVIDAETGALIWKVEQGGTTGNVSSTEYQHTDMDDSIPSDVTVIDTDGDGIIDRGYVGDTGGRIWRFDMQGSDKTEWAASVLASVGRHANGGPENDRRFFHRPDFVQSEDETGAFDAVLLGSGDRAHPLGDTVQNYFYMIKDRVVDPGVASDTGIVHDDLGDVSDNCLQDDSCGADAPDLTDGWKMALDRGTGEKSLSTPLTISGVVFFTSFLPPGSNEATTCGPSEGSGVLYSVDLFDATAVYNYNAADDEPGQGDNPNSKSDRGTDLKSGGIPAEVVPIPSEGVILPPDLGPRDVPGSTRWRTFWYTEENTDGG